MSSWTKQIAWIHFILAAILLMSGDGIGCLHGWPTLESWHGGVCTCWFCWTSPISFQYYQPWHSSQSSLCDGTWRGCFAIVLIRDGHEASHAVSHQKSYVWHYRCHVFHSPSLLPHSLPECTAWVFLVRQLTTLDTSSSHQIKWGSGAGIWGILFLYLWNIEAIWLKKAWKIKRYLKSS